MPEAGRASAACLLLGCLLLLPGCGGGDGARESSARKPNVLLITIDTLRPDHLGCYGYPRKTSPYIDTLARRGVVFRRAITAAGRTVQSFPSILTGVYPTVHGLRYEGQSNEALKDRPTLTRVLKENGYAAFAVTQGLNVGLHRDFDFYDPDVYLDPEGKKVYMPTRNDREATQKAVQWLRARKDKEKPFFLWVRYNAPHWPYEAPAPYTDMFDPEYHGSHAFNDERLPGVERGDIIFGKTRLPARQIEHAVAHYDGEVAYADLAAGELLRAFEKMNLLERTLVVLTADHGESLGEHDYFFEHGAYLYDPTVRVPLIMSLPSVISTGLEVAAQARTIDIVPTVLELLGLPVPQGLQGVSLADRTRGRGDWPTLVAYSESGRNFYQENPRQFVSGVAGKWRMVCTDSHKLIMIPKDPQPIWELYDLRTDPGESVNVLARYPEVAGRLRKTLLDLLEDDPGREDREETPIPPDLQDNLRSLGYVGGGPKR